MGGHRRAASGARTRPAGSARSVERVGEGRSPPARTRRARRGPTSGRSRGRTVHPPRPRRARSRRRCRQARSRWRRRPSRPARAHSQRLARIVRQPVDVADLEPAPGPRLVDLDRQADALVHRHGQRLGAAHPAEAGGQGDASRGACRRSAGGPPRRTSRRCPAGCPGSRCRSTTPRSSGRTSSARPARARGSPPRSPICRRGSSWRSGPVAPTRGSGARRPACRSGPAASRRRRGRRSSRTIASNASQLRTARPVPP